MGTFYVFQNKHTISTQIVFNLQPLRLRRGFSLRKKGEKMQKIIMLLACVSMVGTAFANGENIATSKAYVDTAIQQKQEKIPANNGVTQVLTNTGTPGSVGTKNIYDSSASYATQTDSLITAGDFNTAVQNAIDTEFECIAWRDPNDHNSD